MSTLIANSNQIKGPKKKLKIKSSKLFPNIQKSIDILIEEGIINVLNA